MSEYHLDVTGTIQLGDYSTIQDYIGIVGQEDELIITINNESGDSYSMICNILKDDKFIIDTRGGSIDGKQQIVAIRQK